ncbi:MAG: DUF3298 domain-containing protein [Bacteroidaceae bacterium]|nr:DUF3298 domain-containing protein [Bacteroidaceae bacterium]
MKRYIIMLLSVLAIISGCKNVQGEKSAGKESNNGNIIIFDTLRIKESFPLDSIDKNSPTLNVDITLLAPKTTDENLNADISNCIAYAAFGREGSNLQSTLESVLKSLTENYYTLRNSYINEKDINPDAPWFKAYYMLDSEAVQGPGNIVCYTVNNEVYEGGAHPYHIISAVNFDATSGKEITLQDIFTAGCDSLLTERLTTRLTQQHKAASVQGLKEMGYSINEMFVTNNFAMEKDSIFFIYNEYEIAPYSCGNSRIGFKYDELKDILK